MEEDSVRADQENEYDDVDNEFVADGEYGSSEAPGHYKSLHAIFLIDAHSWMREKSDDGYDHLMESIKCCMELMKEKLPTSSGDKVAVVLYGTEQHNNPCNIPGVTVLCPLDTVTVDTVKKMDEAMLLFGNQSVNVMKSDDAPETKQEEFSASKEIVSLQNALAIARYYLARSSSRATQRSVYIFTNYDDPHVDDENDRRNSIHAAQDLKSDGIDVLLFPLGSEDPSAFDVSLFFKDIVTQTLITEDVSGMDIFSRFERLLSKLKRNISANMSKISLPWILTPESSINVKIYHLYKSVKPPARVAVRRDDNKVVKLRSRYIEEGTSDAVHPAQMVPSMQAGREVALFDPAELATIKAMSPLGFKLLCFKPESHLKDWMNVQPSLFIYPDEQKRQGSTCAFRALHQAMINQKVIAICVATLRSGSFPRYVAMTPSTSPAGMHVIFLPYENEVRSVGIEPINLDSGKTQEYEDSAKLLIRRMTLQSFSPSEFYNPDNRRHGEVMYSAVMNQLPQLDPKIWLGDINAIDSSQNPSWNEAVTQLQTLVWPHGPPPKQVVRSIEDEAAARKKIKTEAVSESAKQLDWAKMVEDDTVEKRTVVELKAFLQSKNVFIPPSARKAQLVQLVKDFFSA